MIDVPFITVPNCAPRTKSDREGAAGIPGLKVEYRDVIEHPETLRQYRVPPAPGIVINGKLEYTGGSTKPPCASASKSRLAGDRADRADVHRRFGVISVEGSIGGECI